MFQHNRDSTDELPLADASWPCVFGHVLFHLVLVLTILKVPLLWLDINLIMWQPQPSGLQLWMSCLWAVIFIAMWRSVLEVMGGTGFHASSVFELEEK